MVIAIVSDGDLGRALAFLLLAEGYAVETLGSGEALFAFGPERADCLVIDQDLPGMSGIDTIRLLRLRSSIPSILLTDDIGPGVYDEAGQLGARLIEKPFHGARLLIAVREALTARAPG